MADEVKVITIDCQGLSTSGINENLRSLAPETRVELQNLMDGQHGIGAALDCPATISCAGVLGDFGLMLGSAASFEVNGNVGDSLGHSLIGGRILIRESAGDYVGAFATGGLIAVLGQVGYRCGYCLQGGEVFVRGSAGDEAARCMRNGELVLGNGAGDNLGVGMTGGTVFVRGKIKSHSKNIRMARMKDADAMRLSLLLARAGIKGNFKDFKAFRPQIPRK